MSSATHEEPTGCTKADVVIIGGGAVGCAAAYYLARLGVSVVLLEKGRVGEGASFGNAGQMTPSDCIPLAARGVVGKALRWSVQKDAPFTMGAALTPSKVPWLVRFAIATRRDMSQRIAALRDLGRLSMACVEDLHAEEKIDCGLARTGVLNVYETAAGLAGGLKNSELLRRHGVTAHDLTSAEARELEPAITQNLQGAVYFPDDAYCDPFRFVSELARVATRCGAEIREGAPVVSLSCDARGCSVATSTEVIYAENVVLAAGVGISAIARQLGVRVPIIAGKGYSIDAKVPTLPRIPLLMFDRRVAVTPIGLLARFAGLMDIGDSSPAVDPRRREYLIRTARGSLARQELEVERAWAGSRPCAPDGVPIVGQLERHSNVIVAGGHAMVGMTMAAGTGRIVSDLVVGRDLPMDVGALLPGRFSRP